MVNLNQPPGVVIEGHDGEWWTRCPLCLETGPLDHDIRREDDGTFTVTPSIVCGVEGCTAHFLIEHSVVRLV